MTNLTATLYGITVSTSPPVSVHDCKNHWDTGKVTKKPTCTEPGEKTFTCSICKSTKKESVPATGHNYASAWTTDRPATCEKTGTESRHCQNENCTATTEQTGKIMEMKLLYVLVTDVRQHILMHGILEQ